MLLIVSVSHTTSGYEMIHSLMVDHANVIKKLNGYSGGLIVPGRKHDKQVILSNYQLPVKQVGRQGMQLPVFF